MKKFQTKTYLLKSPKLKPQREPLRFLFISDLHNKTFGQKNCRLLQEMEHLDPQGVLIGGDLLVAKPGYSMEVAMDFVRETARRFPVYYAPGNHEYRMRIYPEVYGDMYPRYRRVLDDAGVQILDNREVQIKIGENRICLYGFEMDREYYRKGRRQTLAVAELEKMFGKPSREMYTILLAHNPLQGDAYLDWGADVTLSGHLHGGMMRLGGRAVVSPDFTLFPKYGCGLYRKGDRSLIVSAGLGEHTIPVRLFNPRELVVLELEGI